jgi:DNA-binding beta-propeller fold protein YncE
VVTRTIQVEKNPSQIVFLDATYLLVTETDGDSIALIDRAAGTVASRIPVFEKGAPHGFSPSALAYDPATKRLYAVLAGVNAVEAYDVGAGAPPTLTPVGRIPTAWWPTGVMIAPDGALVIVNGKGHGSGTDKKPYPWGEGPITSRMRGSIQRVPAGELADLGAMSATVQTEPGALEHPRSPHPGLPARRQRFPHSSGQPERAFRPDQARHPGGAREQDLRRRLRRSEGPRRR